MDSYEIAFTCLAVLTFLVWSVLCRTTGYRKGYREGSEDGHEKGYELGLHDGLETARGDDGDRGPSA